ncbi:MAG: hypothetical protein WCE61_16570 [Candidatus Acidiferrum sp.]
MGVLAHPDDESLGIGGVLARESRLTLRRPRAASVAALAKTEKAAA